MKKKNTTSSKKRMNLIIMLSSAGALLVFAVIGLVAYLPGKMSTAAYDFLYTSNYVAHSKYFVKDGKVQVESNSKYEFMNDREEASAVIYRYDSATDTSSVVADNEVVNLKVSDDNRSPDGYSVVMTYSGGNSFSNPLVIDGGADYGYKVSLRKGLSSRNITVEKDEFSSFMFLAWVIED
jgi:hypothetical protein